MPRMFDLICSQHKVTCSQISVTCIHLILCGTLLLLACKPITRQWIRLADGKTPTVPAVVEVVVAWSYQVSWKMEKMYQRHLYEQEVRLIQ